MLNSEIERIDSINLFLVSEYGIINFYESEYNERLIKEMLINTDVNSILINSVDYNKTLKELMNYSKTKFISNGIIEHSKFFSKEFSTNFDIFKGKIVLFPSDNLTLLLILDNDESTILEELILNSYTNILKIKDEILSEFIENVEMFIEMKKIQFRFSTLL
jgi:hypothetical protein